jgi:hypothetical protein
METEDDIYEPEDGQLDEEQTLMRHLQGWLLKLDDGTEPLDERWDEEEE